MPDALHLAALQRRIVITLFASQSLVGAAQIAAFTVMPIVAALLTGSDGAAGVPATVLLLGRAAAAYPMGWIMDRAGRRLGLLLGFALAVVGAAAALAAIAARSFLGFSVGIALMGGGRAAGEQMRYTAAEVYPPLQRARAIGLIVLAGTVGAIAGPLLVDPAGRWAERMGQWAAAGPFALAAGLIFLAWALTLIFLRPDPSALAPHFQTDLAGAEEASARSLASIFANSHVRLAVAALTISQLVMTLLMVITPLHMTRHHHGLQSISWVMMAHTLGMFGLSSFTGRLVERRGPAPVIVAGAGLLILSALMTPLSPAVPHLATSLFLLGLGWNLCYIAGSALLTAYIAAGERGRVQGASEAFIALASGAGSLSTGFLFAQGGMVVISAVGLALALIFLAGMAWTRGQRSGGA